RMLASMSPATASRSSIRWLSRKRTPASAAGLTAVTVSSSATDAMMSPHSRTERALCAQFPKGCDRPVAPWPRKGIQRITDCVGSITSGLRMSASEASAGRVLIAEDDDSLRRLIELRLVSEGYEVRCAEDGM